MIDSLWKQYVMEREDLQVLEKDCGFICYKIRNDECFIQDIFVQRTERLKGYARELTREVEGLAKEKGCKFMTCWVSNFWVGNDYSSAASESLKAILHDGFKILSAQNGRITLFREIK